MTAIVAAAFLFIALPDSARSWAPSFLRSPTFHLGLDLAGGTQLDFRISEEEMQQQVDSIQKEIDGLTARGVAGDSIILLQNQLRSIETQRTSIVEAIRTVLERRINSLGVSEATITPSYIGNEKHLLVECPGIIETQKCIDTVGKTIQLEFKEEQTEPTPEYEKEIRARVQSVRTRLKEPGESLAKVGEDIGADLGVSYTTEARYFRDQLPKGLEGIWNRGPRDGILPFDATVKANATDSAGQPTTTDVPGVFLVEVLRARTATGRLVNEAPKAFDILQADDSTLSHTSHIEKKLDAGVPAPIVQAIKSMQPGALKPVTLEKGAAILFLRKFVPGQTQMRASHILVAYKGASSAGEEVTRTKEEALAVALDLRRQLASGTKFETLARSHSDGPSGKEGGSLGTFGLGTMVPAFEQAALQLKTGEVSAPVETQFGYHLIRMDAPPAPTGDIASYELLTIRGADAGSRAVEIIGRLQRGAVEAREDQIVLRTLFFSLLPTGWKDTQLDGTHFRSASVTMDPTTNIPIVQIAFDDEGAKLFEQLTKNNIGKRLAIFVGGQLISAPTVQQAIVGGTAVITGSQTFEEANALATDLNTGAIPAPIYLTGQRTVEATLGAEALAMSLKAGLVGMVVLMLFMLVVYRLLGVIANIALLFYVLIFIALLKLPLFLFSHTYIVLTLAGVAGMILSIGMAIDANVLIFERIKEEVRKGKILKTASETGFNKAWSSIRDGNISTLITCAVLFVIGTSIVRGFAITLATGIFISMFTAIIVTRWMIRKVADMPIAEKMGLFVSGAKARQNP